MKVEDYIIILSSVTPGKPQSKGNPVSISFNQASAKGNTTATQKIAATEKMPISESIAATDTISVKIEDSQKKVVQTFEDVKSDKKGVIHLNTESLPAGTYNCILQVNGVARSKQSFTIK
jgi:hypothetical protein